jgi:acyl-CoA reductase-like NAD-dependent aldehyde dehydrogenase
MQYINEHPRPLALYYFGNDKARRDEVINGTTAGGVCINETLFHLAQEELPFGGVGPSGSGSYHGIAGFKTFSHEKSVFYQSKFNLTGIFRAPYGKLFNTIIKMKIGK